MHEFYVNVPFLFFIIFCGNVIIHILCEDMSKHSQAVKLICLLCIAATLWRLYYEQVWKPAFIALCLVSVLHFCIAICDGVANERDKEESVI